MFLQKDFYEIENWVKGRELVHMLSEIMWQVKILKKENCKNKKKPIEIITIIKYCIMHLILNIES